MMKNEFRTIMLLSLVCASWPMNTVFGAAPRRQMDLRGVCEITDVRTDICSATKLCNDTDGMIKPSASVKKEAVIDLCKQVAGVGYEKPYLCTGWLTNNAANGCTPPTQPKPPLSDYGAMFFYLEQDVENHPKPTVLQPTMDEAIYEIFQPNTVFCVNVFVQAIDDAWGKVSRDDCRAAYLSGTLTLSASKSSATASEESVE